MNVSKMLHQKLDVFHCTLQLLKATTMWLISSYVLDMQIQEQTKCLLHYTMLPEIEMFV